MDWGGYKGVFNHVGDIGVVFFSCNNCRRDNLGYGKGKLIISCWHSTYGGGGGGGGGGGVGAGD